MVKDVKTGEIFRTDHLVEAVIESRLKGDREARGQAALPEAAEDDKKKKKKKVVKSTAVKLEDSVVQEYESTLAQVRATSCDHITISHPLTETLLYLRLTTTPVPSSVNLSKSSRSSTLRLETSSLTLSNST